MSLGFGIWGLGFEVQGLGLESGTLFGFLRLTECSQAKNEALVVRLGARGA